MTADPASETFARALDGLVARIREDRSILAAILCGSMSHDVVWARSDIDLVLVTIDDRKVPVGDRALNADGVNVHVILIPRAEFRKTVEGAVTNSFMHSFLAKGRLLYTHDETITELCAHLSELGFRDRTVQLFRAATAALPALDKARKWLVTRGDLEYCSLWILASATSLARIEVIAAGLVADREVVPQALGLNRAFFGAIYVDLLNQRKSPAAVEAALGAAEEYIATRAPELFAPLIGYLGEVGEIRSATEIDDHFKRHFDVEGVVTACEYLAHRGLIGKAATSVQLTRRSNVTVEELAFFGLGDGGHGR
jgi:predicted nucleotidyltransferase